MNPIKKAIFSTAIPFVGAMFKFCNKFINVIYYHDIVSGEGYGSQKTNIELFKKQIQYIASNGYKTYTFDELNDKNILFDKKSVLITFDDGWRSNYTEIFEFMKQVNVKYNIFLEIGNIDENPEYLTWDMVREMHSSALVGFGAHTYSHPDMSNLCDIDTFLEFDKVNQKICDELGFLPKDFCYPFGKWSEDSNKYIIDQTPYTRIYTSDLKYSYMQNGKTIFGRNSINGDYPFSIFVNMLKGHYNIFDLLRGKKN